MRWEYCEHCYIDGHCENQDRGHECENYGKRMKDRCERLQKQLEIADTALAEIEKNGTNPEIKTITALCVNNFLLAHKARKEIKELNK